MPPGYVAVPMYDILATMRSADPTKFDEIVSLVKYRAQESRPLFPKGKVVADVPPIAEADLAAALIDTVGDESKKNYLWNIGGPDDGLSMKQQVRGARCGACVHATRGSAGECRLCA